MTSVGGSKIISLFYCRQLSVVVATTNSSTRNSNRKILESTIRNVSPKQRQQGEQLQHRWFQTSVSKKFSAVDPATASTLTNAATGAEETTTATTSTTTKTTIKRVKKIKKKSIALSSHDKYSGYTATPIGNKGLQQYEWINFAPYGIKIIDYSKCNTTSVTPMSRWPLPKAPSKKPGTYDKRLVFAFLTLFMTGSVYYVYNYSEPLPPGYWEAIERGDMPMENLLQSSDTSSTNDDNTIPSNDTTNFDDDIELDENYDEWAEEKK